MEIGNGGRRKDPFSFFVCVYICHDCLANFETSASTRLRGAVVRVLGHESLGQWLKSDPVELVRCPPSSSFFLL